jgi:hypothetical protein
MKIASSNKKRRTEEKKGSEYFWFQSFELIYEYPWGKITFASDT